MFAILMTGYLWGVTQSYLASPAGREAALIVSRRLEVIENKKLEVERQLRSFQSAADQSEAKHRALNESIAELRAFREALPQMIEANKRAAQKAKEDAGRAKEEAERAKKPRI